MSEFIPQISVFLIGICASFIGAQVGSGGAIVIPSLIFLGLPPQVAIATHKLAGIFSSLTAIRKFSHAKVIQWRAIMPLTILKVTGALIAARILLSMDTEILSRLIGFVILIPLPFLLISHVGLKRVKTTRNRRIIGFILYFLISTWTGIFSPGGLTLVLYLFVLFFGFTFIEAAATQKIPSFIGNITITIIFIHAGIVNWSYGIPLVVGYIIGSYLGVSFALYKGNLWVRRLLITVVIISSIKLLFF